MQNLYGNFVYSQMFQQHTLKLFQAISKNSNNEDLLSLLSDQKRMIQMLLENQNVLTARFQSLLRSQTTDTQNNFQETDPIIPQKRVQNQSSCQKKLQAILKPTYSQNPSCSRAYSLKKIEIISQFSNDESKKLMSLQLNQQNKQHQQSTQALRKPCETKNIIKNFGKSILTFMRKNKMFTDKILRHYQINQSEFNQQFERFKGNLNSISDLKVFWTDEGNPLAKVFRLVSNVYLRKHSLKHTFSSRVRNVSIHIKYRMRLMDILKNPQKFSSIKYK